MSTTPPPPFRFEYQPATGESGAARVSPWLGFAAALQFLTISPPLVRRLFTDAELVASVGYFPLVGLLLGGILAIWDAGLRWLLPVEVASVLVLAAWIVLTGGLHIDGFLDSCDALLGGRTPEERLTILRDERVGAFAVAGGFLLLMLKFTALARLESSASALLVACVLGRWLICLAILLFPYARAQGLGRTMKDQAGRREGLLATLLAVLAVGVIAPVWGLWATIVAVLVGAWAARFTLRRLPGLTGDSYGAICELGEVAVLVVWAACEKRLA
ncbi:MAG TPA: adenosylcobinamide-GDP ribazoletransferase [Pirellulales bacterium]|jgi:adenosylcobinamide-GDP ribazoletransferase|nr:adenosylcobinamide-GDP ribazoletransferase [Pirellulales bacterium]